MKEINLPPLLTRYYLTWSELDLRQQNQVKRNLKDLIKKEGLNYLKQEGITFVFDARRIHTGAYQDANLLKGYFSIL